MNELTFYSLMLLYGSSLLLLFLTFIAANILDLDLLADVMMFLMLTMLFAMTFFVFCTSLLYLCGA